MLTIKPQLKPLRRQQPPEPKPKYVRVLYLKQAKKQREPQEPDDWLLPRRQSFFLNEKRSIAYLSSLIQDESNNKSALFSKRQSLNYRNPGAATADEYDTPMHQLGSRLSSAVSDSNENNKDLEDVQIGDEFITRPLPARNSKLDSRAGSQYSELQAKLSEDVRKFRKTTIRNSLKESSLVKIVGEPPVIIDNDPEERRQSATLLYNIRKYGINQKSTGIQQKEYEENSQDAAAKQQSTRVGSKYPPDTRRASMLEDDFKRFCSQVKQQKKKDSELQKSEKGASFSIMPPKKREAQNKSVRQTSGPLKSGSLNVSLKSTISNKRSESHHNKIQNNNQSGQWLLGSTTDETRTMLRYTMKNEKMKHKKNIISRMNFKEIDNFNWGKVDKNHFALGF